MGSDWCKNDLYFHIYHISTFDLDHIFTFNICWIQKFLPDR